MSEWSDLKKSLIKRYVKNYALFFVVYVAFSLALNLLFFKRSFEETTNNVVSVNTLLILGAYALSLVVIYFVNDKKKLQEAEKKQNLTERDKARARTQKKKKKKK